MRDPDPHSTPWCIPLPHFSHTSYITFLTPTPLGHQQPEDIHRLLEGAKGPTASVITNVMQGPADDAYDASIENAIREDLLQHGNSSGNVQLQQFINQHISGERLLR